MWRSKSTRIVTCPHCGEEDAYAAIPSGAWIVPEDLADGEVQATCLSCGNTFPVFYKQG